MNKHDDDTVDSERADAAASPEVWSLLAGALDPEAPAAEIRDRLLEELRRSERFSPFVSEVAAAFGLSEDAVREAFACMRDESAWRPAFFPGSEILSTPALGAAHAVIARVPAGTCIPRHAHPRRELTYVLDGEIVENGARRVGPGELIDPELGSEHQVAIGGEDPCLVVFALPDASA